MRHDNFRHLDMPVFFFFFISATQTIFFGVVSIEQLVEVADSAVLGGVVEILSSIPTVGHKNIFQHFPA